MQHQQERHIANQTISQVSGLVDTDGIELIENESKTRARLKRLTGFKKYPDKPLGEVINHKIARRIKQTGRRKKNHGA